MTIKVILVVGLCVALLLAFSGCSSRDTYYNYGQTSFVSLAGSSMIGEVIFRSSDSSSIDIFVKMPSGKVKIFKDIAREDIESECSDSADGRVDCSIGAFEFTFIHGTLTHAYCRNHSNCKFSFSSSKEGPFITFPMTVKQVMQTLGKPQKVIRNSTKLR